MILCLERIKNPSDSAAFRVKVDKFRGGGSQGRTLKPAVAALETQEGGNRVEWVYETNLEWLDYIKQLFKEEQVMTQNEIADVLGVSAQMVCKYRDKGCKLGLWAEWQWNDWLREGKRLRKLGKTVEPELGSGAHTTGGTETIDDDGEF